MAEESVEEAPSPSGPSRVTQQAWESPCRTRLFLAVHWGARIPRHTARRDRQDEPRLDSFDQCLDLVRRKELHQIRIRLHRLGRSVRGYLRALAQHLPEHESW